MTLANSVSSALKRILALPWWDLTVAILLIFWLGTWFKIWFNHYEPANFFSLMADDQNWCVDFVKYYACGWIGWTADHGPVYDPAYQFKLINQLLSPIHLVRPNYFQYPPTIFAVLAPLVFFRLPTACALWFVSTTILGLAGLALLARFKGDFQWLDYLFMSLMLMSSAPAWQNAMFGQSAWLFVGLVSLFYWAWLKGKNFPAGVALAFSAYKPQYLFLLLPIVVASRRWKILVWACAAEAILVLLACVVVGWQNVLYYPASLIKAESGTDTFGLSSAYMISLRGIARMFLPTGTGALIGCFTGLAGSLAVYFLIRHGIKRDAVFLNQAFALSIIVYLITSPHVFLYDCLILGAALLLTVVSLRPTQLLKAGVSGFGRLWVVVLVLFLILSWPGYLSSRDDIWIVRAAFLCNFLLLVSGGLSVYRQWNPLART